MEGNGGLATSRWSCSGAAALVGVLIAALGVLLLRDTEARVASGNDMAGLMGPFALLLIVVGAVLALAGAFVVIRSSME
jgi:hypothetical protein